jgi:eukaryotic-like serine/threonine-protein kinase
LSSEHAAPKLAATAESQKFLDHSGNVQNLLLGSLARLQLGRAYALAADTAKAKTAYQDFIVKISKVQ